MAFDIATIALILVVVGAGGVLKGVVGFGYAIAGTATLASLLSPTVAVTLMIVPMLAANLRLLGELSRSGLRSCVARFWPFVLAAGIGTIVGMIALSVVSPRLVASGLGAFVLAYVALQQDRLRVPGVATFERVCFVETTSMKATLGFAAGVVFGVSNAGVQVVAYLDSLDLDRETFAGVLAMILVGVSTVRLGVAYELGLFDVSGAIWVSVLAAIPGVGGVAVGERLRGVATERTLSRLALAVFAVIATRLLLKGLVGL